MAKYTILCGLLPMPICHWEKAKTQDKEIFLLGLLYWGTDYATPRLPVAAVDKIVGLLSIHVAMLCKKDGIFSFGSGSLLPLYMSLSLWD